MSRRTERLASVLQQELAAIIQRELLDPRITGMPSITRVEVAPDLSTADIFVSVMGTGPQQALTMVGLKHSAGKMRSMLTAALTTRTVPFLKFHIDEQLKKELAVLDLIRQVGSEKEEMEARAARLAEAEAAETARAAEKAAARAARLEQQGGDAAGRTMGSERPA